MNPKQHALAAEVRAEAAAQRISTKGMQEAVGVSPSAWNNYYVSLIRDVPMGVVVRTAEALGLSASELLRRAEARAAATAPEDEIEAGLNAHSRRVLAEQREKFGVPEVARDPFERARADQDDGASGRTA